MFEGRGGRDLGVSRSSVGFPRHRCRSAAAAVEIMEIIFLLVNYLKREIIGIVASSNIVPYIEGHI